MYLANFELNQNTLEINSEVCNNEIQANLIVNVTPDRLSMLINDTGFITASALIPLENDILDLQDTKVDKVAGKGLSTNDFTNALKTKLEGIEAGAEVNTVNSVNGMTGDVVIEIPDSATWGNITGTLSDQTDLQQALNAKQNTISDLDEIRAGASAGSTAVQPNDNITQLTNNAGYITGITSTDVTTALGYTPYDSSNPNGYTSNVGTVTSVNNINPVNGNVSLTIPTVNDATLTITQGGTTKGTFTANASSNTTIALDAGTTYTAGTGLKLSNNDTEFNIMQQDISAEAVNVVGTLTENDNVYSGFSGSNYLEIPATLTLNASDSFEIQFKFYQNSGNTNYRYILSGQDTTANRTFRIYRFNNYCYVNMPYGTGNNNAFNPQSSSIASGQWIWVKVTRTINSTNFTMQAFVSTDGTNWTRFGNNTVSGTPYVLTNMPLLLGSGATSTTYLNGSIDLKECYIKINGNMWWSGQGQTAKSVAKATTSLYGLVKPDGTSIMVNDGVISANVQTYTAGTGLDLTNDEFSIMQANRTTSNFSIVGSPTITDGVASNFSDSNYLTFVNPFSQSMTSFEIGTKFKLNSASISNQALIDTGVNSTGATNTSIRYTITDAGKLRFRTSTSGSQTYVVDMIGTTTLSTNTVYYTKVTYSSSTGYAMYVSTDGSTWTSEATSSNTTLPIYREGNLYAIGDNIASGFSLDGYVYLNDTYVKVNGSTVWTPYTIGGVAMATDSLYGLVKPDGNTISVNNGVISGFSGNYNDLSNKPTVPSITFYWGE